MNIPEYVAQQTERTAESFCEFIISTHQDRLDWHPHLEGAAHIRSILEQVAECINVNHTIAALLRGEPPVIGQLTELGGGEGACERLTESAVDLAGAIRTLTDADLEKTFEHPRGKMLGRNLIVMPMRNMGYHIGQLNLIQMLYGDAEFHVPKNWR
jgi:hypothetical protein